LHQDISHFVEDIKEGDIFVVIRGRNFDNLKDVEEAVRRGAKLVITPERLDIKVEQIVSGNTRKTAEEWAERLYKFDDLEIVGITGTNGKTTTSFIIREILSSCAGETALIGTVIWDDLTEVKTSKLTTPERFYIFRILGRARRVGGKFAVMEVSSVGLDQGRVDGIKFKVGVFTNLSRDHLDYHGSMENYLNAKLKLFRMLDGDAFAVINSDDLTRGIY
jgi:UDP-N-acetylmuramyl tripeptide synthase